MHKYFTSLLIGFFLSLSYIAAQAETRASGKVASAVSGKLVRSSGKNLTNYSINANPSFYVIYHSASWCSSCKRVTPKVVDAYKKLTGKQNRKVEVIHVNHDASEKAMRKYLAKSKINFPALRHSETQKNLLSKIKPVKSLPTVLLVDAKGKVLSDDRNDVLAKLQQLAQ